MDRSVRTFIAVVLWLLAGLIAINNIVAQQTELDNWWLPLLLFIAGVALVLIPDGWSWRGVSHEEEAEADAAIAALQPPEAAPALPAAPAAELVALQAEPEPVAAAPEPEPAPAEAVVVEPELEPEPAPVEAVVVEPEPEPEPVPAEAVVVEPELEPEPEPVPAAAEEPAPEPESEPVPAVPDDLTKIEGIGPKMDAALKAAGITTFAQLSQTSEADLHAAIEAAGMRFAPSAGTWADQAAFAARGDWAGLAAFQSTLTAGRKG